jgi:hypothetical protein
MPLMQEDRDFDLFKQWGCNPSAIVRNLRSDHRAV